MGFSIGWVIGYGVAGDEALLVVGKKKTKLLLFTLVTNMPLVAAPVA